MGENGDGRFQVCPAYSAAQSGLYGGGGDDPGARNRGEHGHFLAPGSNPAAAAAGEESSATGSAHDEGASLREQLGRERHFSSHVMRGHHYGSNWGGNAISHPMFRDFQAHNDVFSGMFCRFRDPVSLTFAGQSERVNAELVSGTYFSVLGVNTILGRAFTPEDDRVPLGHPLAMLTYDYWKRRFGGDPGIVGKNLIVNGHNVTVLGVVQPGFDGVELGYSTKVFIPIMI